MNQASGQCRALVLSKEDNVAVLLEPARRGDLIRIEGATTEREVIAVSDIARFHKVALETLGAGRKVVRAATTIGISNQAIKVGEWVHIHNLVSSRARMQ